MWEQAISLKIPSHILYHTGYLTIKSYDRELEEYILGFPNKEVEQAFFLLCKKLDGIACKEYP